MIIKTIQYLNEKPGFKLLPTNIQIKIVAFFSHNRDYDVGFKDVGHFLKGIEEVEVHESFISLRAANKSKPIQRVLAYRLYSKSWNKNNAWSKSVHNFNRSPDYKGLILTHMIGANHEVPEVLYIAGRL